MSIVIPCGTKMYLKKKNPKTLYLRPCQTIENDSLFVAYDVRINGETIIPKETRVLGDWVTENNEAQFQAKRIYLTGTGQILSADSDIFQGFSFYNCEELGNPSYFYKIMDFHSSSNINRRIVNSRCQTFPLLDDRLNMQYIEINTNEIPINFTTNFVISLC